MSYTVNKLASVKELGAQMIPTSCQVLLDQARASLDIAQSLVIHKQTINAVMVTMSLAVGFALGFILPCLVFWIKFRRCLKWQWQLDHGLLPPDSTAAKLAGWKWVFHYNLLRLKLAEVMAAFKGWSDKANTWATKWRRLPKL